jgi:hypothetical protein
MDGVEVGKAVVSAEGGDEVFSMKELNRSDVFRGFFRENKLGVEPGMDKQE